MKKDVFLLLRRWQFPLLMLLSVMPLILTSLCVSAPDSLGAAYLLFGAYALLSGACLLASGAHRLPAAALGAVVIAALSLWRMPIREQPLLLLLPAVLIGLLFFSLPLAARKYESDMPPYVYFIGIAAHVVIQFLHHYFGIGGQQSPYAPVESVLTASLIGYVVLLLLSMNRISLDNASLARHRIPAGMRAVNTVMTLVFLAASLLLSIMPAIVRGITALRLALLGMIRQLIRFLLSFLPSSPDSSFGTQGPMDAMLPMEQAVQEQSRFALLLEKIASIISFIILISCTLFLAYSLVKLTLRLIRRMALHFRTYMTAASAEYEDEITDTREDGAQREIRFLLKKRLSSQPADRTPVGRIRQTYARLLRRRQDWPDSSTARENLSSCAAELYERARYSEHPITEKDAERFTAQIKQR